MNISTAIENGVMILTLNRPDKLNALNLATLDELKEAISQVYENPDVRGVIITGAGEKAFVAGADINEIASLNPEKAKEVAENGQTIFFMIENCPKPVIAAVNGYALGGGCELAMACHIRVASENAMFGQPEVNLGIIPGYGGTQRLPQLVGKARAIELLITADMVDAQAALTMGLVNYVVSQEELLGKCMEILAKAASKPPLQIAKVLQSVEAHYNKEADGYLAEADAFAACTALEDFKEGTAAFLEKRKANFKGQ